MSKNPVLQFEGDLRLWTRNDAGVYTPILTDATDEQGNTPVEASATVFGYEAGDEISVTSKRRGRYGQKIYSEQQPGSATISLTLVAVPPAILARVFNGDAAETAISGTAVTGETVTFAADAPTKPLAHDYIASTPAPVVTNGLAGEDLVTYVAGTDYRINSRAGTITRLSGGAITSTGTVTLAYTYRSYSLITIKGGSKPLESFRITGDMLNRPDQSDLYFEAYHAKLGVDGEVDLFSDEPITVTLTGSLLTPDDKDAPYTVRRVDLSA